MRKFWDFLQLAGQSIIHRRVRSWLTVIGVFIGIMAVVALISIGLGFDKTIKDQVSQVFGVDTFMILHEDAFGSQRHGPDDAEEYSLDLEYLKSIDGVKTAAAIRERTGFVQGPPGADGVSQQGFLQLMGLSTEMMTEFVAFLGELEVQEGGRLLQDGDTMSTVLGPDIAERLGANVGDTILIAGDGDAEANLNVVGIIAQTDEEEDGGGFTMGGGGPDADTIYVPFDTMEVLFGPADDVSFTLVRTQENADVNDVADDAEELLKERGSDVTAVTYDDISDAIGQMMTIASAVLAGIAGISLLVGGVGVMNTMYTSVLERTKEIGVMKAVGAKNSHILSIFLIESGLMGLVGGIVGSALGIGLSIGASSLLSQLFGFDLLIVVSPLLIFYTLAGSFAIGAIAGLLPARRASKLQVVDALRYE